MCFKMKNKRSSEDYSYYKSNSKADINAKDFNYDNTPGSREVHQVDGKSDSQNNTQRNNIKIYLPDNTAQEIGFNEIAYVREIINNATSKHGVKPQFVNCFALQISLETTSEFHWLHQDTSIEEIRTRYFLKAPMSDWKFEAKIRFFPKNIEDLYESDAVTFKLLYHQIVAQYLKLKTLRMDMKTMSELCALQIKLISLTSSKKMLFHKTYNIQELVPACLLNDMNVKKMRDNIRSHFKSLKKAESPNQVMNDFLKLLVATYNYTEERFRVYSKDLNPYENELVVSAKLGIRTYNNIKIAEFHDVKITHSAINTNNDIVITLHSISTNKNVTISAKNEIVENLLTLIDGYVMLYSKKNSSILNQNTLKKHKAPASEDGDYSNPIARDYEISTKDIEILNEIATGRFSKIYKGNYRSEDGRLIKNVAIKMCEENAEKVVQEIFIEEAFLLHKFDNNNHIVKLVGICKGVTQWIVTEHANLGSLGNYLQENKNNLELKTLLLYAYQISIALCHLESMNFVHKNVAIKNVLIFSPALVKLTGFDCFTWSNKIKEQHLPIRWMSPESIKTGKFSSASDVWSYGVCVWEILTYGLTPYNVLNNIDVIVVIDQGERLQKPSNCPYKLYSLLNLCWNYEPEGRLKFNKVKENIYDIYLEISQETL